VAAVLIHEAIGDQLTCVFVDHGLMRANEAEQVVSLFRNSYNIPLVHVDASARTSERVALAAQLALTHDAHLIGLAPTGWSTLLYASGAFDAGVAPVPFDWEPVRRACRGALDTFEAQARALGVHAIESRLVDEEAGLALAMHGRYSDLIVVGQTRGTDLPSSVRVDFPEHVVLNCTTPVLVVPSTGSFTQPGRTVAIAWNGSNEAQRAVRSALPLLQGAQRVHLIMINPRAAAIDDGDEPGADMGLYLARHGVRVEVVSRFSESHADAAILDAANECGADLLVMGAYGRSRFREFLMGGATRTMLQSMTLPVWMTH
ncbi:MAG: universal stress protein, partial [Gammaproteobacteria bacterium]